MERAYEIPYYPREKEYAIRRVKDDRQQRYSTRNTWTEREDWAKRFFHEDSVLSALVLIKTKGDVKEEEPYRPEQQKQSWGEYSSD